MTAFFAVLTVFGAVMFLAIGPMWKAVMSSVELPFGLSQESWIVVMRVFFGVYTIKTFLMALSTLLDGT